MTKPALVEPMIPEIVKITTTMIPALRSVPIIRGLIIPLSAAGHMNDAKALEEYQSAADKKKQQRQKERDKNNKHVIKVKDALQCVEDSLGNGKIGIAFARALLSVITSGAGASKDMMDIIYGPMQECMIQKALQQKNKRSSGLYDKFEPHKTRDKKKLVYSEVVKLRRGKLHPFIPK